MIVSVLPKCHVRLVLGETVNDCECSPKMSCKTIVLGQTVNEFPVHIKFVQLSFTNILC